MDIADVAADGDTDVAADGEADLEADVDDDADTDGEADLEAYVDEDADPDGDVVELDATAPEATEVFTLNTGPAEELAGEVELPTTPNWTF